MESNFQDLVSQVMPLSEVHHASKKGKSVFTYSNKMSNYSSDLSSFMPEHELVELLWENGQIVMQGQSNRTKKSSVGTEFAFNGRLEEKFGQNGAVDSAAHDLPPTVPSAMNDQEDDAAPWLNYAMDDSIQNDYCSEFFSELSGVHMASLSNTSSNLYPANKSSGYSQAAKDSHLFRSSPGASDSSRSRFNNLLNPQQCHNSSENAKPRVLEVGISSGNSNHFGDLNSTRFQKQDTVAQKPLQQSNSAGLMNFSHFSRPAALVKANLRSIDRLRSHEKSCKAASTYPVESTVVESINGLKSDDQPKVDSGSYGKSSVDDAELVQNSTVVNRNSSSPNCQASSFAASMAAEITDTEKPPEAVAASSSVCSGYDAAAASNDPKHKSKKRAREGEESGEESDDLEDETLFAVKKPSSGRGTSGKRSRAAEVHNLSERRRRDRINEKMKALQELIPNCNKVDKASMLDEAIEYLKTLQLQVQMMSMGNGLLVPPMMLPAGMNFQHLRAPPISHFSPLGMGMGIGMGMGLGFGMGMIDLNGSPGLIPVPPLMHGTQFPIPSVPGVAGFHRMPLSSSIHSLGIPGQRHPVSVPHAPLFNSQAGLSPKNPLKVSDKDLSSSNNQQQQCINLEAIENARTKEPKGQASQAVCQLMQKESKESYGGSNETIKPVVNSNKTTETSIS